MNWASSTPSSVFTPRKSVAFNEQCWPIVAVQPEPRGLAAFVSLGNVMDTNQQSVIWLWTESRQPKPTVIIQLACEQLVIINWNVDCVCTLVPHVNKYPNIIFICLSFIFKLIKHYEVRSDPAGTTVEPITRTLLCPAKPINLQFLDRGVQQEEPRAAAGVSLWAVLVFTLRHLPVNKHLFIEHSHLEDWLECSETMAYMANTSWLKK